MLLFRTKSVLSEGAGKLMLKPSEVRRTDLYKLIRCTYKAFALSTCEFIKFYEGGK